MYQKLHEMYGPIVRVGPNALDIVSPELVKPAFNDIKGAWNKVSDMHRWAGVGVRWLTSR